MITTDKEFDEACRNNPRFASIFAIVDVDIDVVQSGNSGISPSGESENPGDTITRGG